MFHFSSVFGFGFMVNTPSEKNPQPISKLLCILNFLYFAPESSSSLSVCVLIKLGDLNLSHTLTIQISKHAQRMVFHLIFSCKNNKKIWNSFSKCQTSILSYHRNDRGQTESGCCATNEIFFRWNLSRETILVNLSERCCEHKAQRNWTCDLKVVNGKMKSMLRKKIILSIE